MSDTKEKKQRTPKNAESITKGALNLPLKERILLRDSLQDSIDGEVELKKAEYEEAAKLAKQ